MANNTNGHRSTMPLSMVAPGETVELVDIRGGRRIRRRLFDLGLTIGMPVRVVQGGATSAMILAVKNDTRLAIGRGIVRKIMVSPLNVNTEDKEMLDADVDHRPCW